ncbi:YjjG family noncanonical pyrimidine nucleotidase [Aequorivita marina]|uniref:YjjG family noncanonical pyrimidine nucleotidase n=1 Tax=Aequorivita marina TaxID=3073654 RepID=UPI0028760113|nr:YjjG family noncanonical pyrimidine nucleotidase [Aequorivita sp. S2608]MDS1296940.1 YjjG family noncanonical pyrimidine nucleotidase [Aequorivita sp. S2608]
MYNKVITDVFFDLDHTLWDFDRNSGLAFQRVFQKHNIPLSVTEFLQKYEPINLGYWKAYREERITKEELRRGRLTETFDAFKMKYSLDIIDALATCYLEELPGDNHLFTGTFDLLDYLKKKYHLHIITNGFEDVQHLKLQKSGINTYFKSVTTSEDVGLKKPHPSVFNAALKKASAQPQKSMMIGDSFEADILGASNVGMHTLFFNYRKEKVSPSYPFVNELLEIKHHL